MSGKLYAQDTFVHSSSQPFHAGSEVTGLPEVVIKDLIAKGLVGPQPPTKAPKEAAAEKPPKPAKPVGGHKASAKPAKKANPPKPAKPPKEDKAEKQAPENKMVDENTAETK